MAINSNFVFFFQFQEKKKIGFYERFFVFISIPFYSPHSHPYSQHSHPYSPHSHPESPHFHPDSAHSHPIPRFPTLIPLIPFPDSQHRLLQIAHFQQVGGLVTKNISVFCLQLFTLYFKEMSNSIDIYIKNFLLYYSCSYYSFMYLLYRKKYYY